MSTQFSERRMSDHERALIAGWIDETRKERGNIGLLMADFSAGWLFLTSIFALLWMILTWILRVAIDVDIGVRTAAGPWVLLIAVTTLAVCSAILTYISRPELDPLHADMESGQVVEELYEFSATKRMQEPEHGALLYFLRAGDGTVLVLADYESGDLGAAEKDPLSSSFLPRERLKLVRAPVSGR